MIVDRAHERLIGFLSIAAGCMALLSLLVGLAGVDWDAEVLSEAATILDAGPGLAGDIAWSFWLSAFGSYLLLVPLALLIFARLGTGKELNLLIFTVGGVIYMVLGAIGSAIFAVGWPELIREYASATPEARDLITRDFEQIERIAGGGFHGVVQNLAGALWLCGVGTMLRAHRSKLAALALAIGALLLLNSVGNLTDLEPLSLVGVLGNVILLPVWAILLGLSITRDPQALSQS